MKKFLILLAGPPATGKSYLVGLIEKRFPELYKVSPDEFKENLADSVGFNNLNEKSQLEVLVWKLYYQALDVYMHVGKKIVLTEYPFSDKQKTQLKNLAKTYDYNIITIRLVADFEILWNRRKKRDLEKSRHLSHIMTHYHNGDRLDDRAVADNHITKKEFQEIINQRQYNNFSLGELIEVDVSDFTKVNYSRIIENLNYEINLKYNDEE